MSDVTKARICGWGLLLGGIVLLGLTGAMNWFQGEHLGVTTAGKFLNSVGSVAVDVFGLLFCGLAAGVCFANRKWVWGGIFALAVLLSAGWSVNSMWGYQATERVSASKTREVEIARVKDADKLEKDSAAKALDLAKSAGNRNARKDFLAANQDAIKSFRDAKVTIVVAPDLGAQSMAEKLGWKVETVQYLQSGYFAVLVIFLKMVGFPGAGFLLSWHPEPPSRTVSGSSDSSGSKGKPSEESTSKPETVLQFPARTAAPPGEFPAPRNDRPKASSEALRVPAPAPTVSATQKLFGSTVSEALRRQPEWTNQQAIADALGVSKGKVSKDLKKLKGQRKVETKRNGKSNAVIARRDRGLHAVI